MVVICFCQTFLIVVLTKNAAIDTPYHNGANWPEHLHIFHGFGRHYHLFELMILMLSFLLTIMVLRAEFCQEKRARFN